MSVFRGSEWSFKIDMLLKGNRILLRTAVPEDVSYIFNWENDPAYSQINSNADFVSEDDIYNWIINRQHDLFLENELRLMICDEKNHVSGSVDLFEFDTNDFSAGMGIIIEEHKRKSGLGTEAILVLADHCFNQIGMKSLWCNIPPNNESSIALFYKCGFRPAHNVRNALPGCMHLRREKT